MRKNCFVRIIEVMLQVIATVIGIMAVLQIFKNYEYKKKLRNKAEIYLSEELGDLQDLRRKVSVLSPETIENETKIKNLLCIMGASLMAFIVVRVFTNED